MLTHWVVPSRSRSSCLQPGQLPSEVLVPQTLGSQRASRGEACSRPPRTSASSPGRLPSPHKVPRRNSVQNAPIGQFAALMVAIFLTISVSGNSRTTCPQLNFQITLGQHLGNIRVTFGQLLDNIHARFGQLPVNFIYCNARSAFGCFSGNFQIRFGQL